jgi:asparagine synthase (glutamine-hydrolysing)
MASYNRADGWALCRPFLRDPSDADSWRSYRCWGADAIAHLRGVFALIIEDGARDLVLGARDPLGVQPLFYSEVGRTLLLSPAIETLLAHPEVPAEINRALLVDYLTRCWPVNDETYFTRVRRVPPGYLMRIDASGRTLNRYWNPVSHGRPAVWTPDNQASERFEVLLEQAVSR